MASTPQHGTTFKPRGTSRALKDQNYNVDKFYRMDFLNTNSRERSPNKKRSSKTLSGNKRSDKALASKMASSKKTPSEVIDAISASQFGTESMMTLLVGQDEQAMVVHVNHLTRDSEFFAAAMKKEWVEGQTRVIRLPEEYPDIVAHYLSFLYSGKVVR
jgi:hypothetical protein